MESTRGLGKREECTQVRAKLHQEQTIPEGFSQQVTTDNDPLHFQKLE